MVSDPSEYVWSSYQCNALDRPSDLMTPHREYLALGRTHTERRKNYRDLFKYSLDKEMIEDISCSVNKGMALGSEQFKEQVEQNFQRRVKPGRVGRPRKDKI
jgi:putative transposase